MADETQNPDAVAYRAAQAEYETIKQQLMSASLEQERVTLAVEVAAVKLKRAHMEYLRSISQ
jgi:hypothetical protein